LSEQPFARIAILGLGAMGGSLAKALSALGGEAPSLVGWSPREEERSAAVEAGAVSEAPSSWEEAVEDAALVVVAAPLDATCRLLKELAEATSPDTLVTDVASLKVPVARAASAAGLDARWVGSHPMTGSEESGFTASRTDLYAGARVWTVAAPEAAAAVRDVEALWRSLGSRPEPIQPEEHDRLMALASPLPQLVSNVLASVLDQGGVPRDRLGPGGADMTRLSASGAVMWRDILEHASPQLIAGLRRVARTSDELAHVLERGDLDRVEDLMNATRAWSRGS
jgi:prephenate dehydrogenase